MLWHALRWFACLVVYMIFAALRCRVAPGTECVHAAYLFVREYRVQHRSYQCTWASQIWYKVQMGHFCLVCRCLLSTDRPKGTRRLKNTDLILDAQSQPQTLAGSRNKLQEQWERRQYEKNSKTSEKDNSKMDANQWRKHIGDQPQHGMASITGIAGMAWAYNNTHLWKEKENPKDLKWQQKSAEENNIKLTESRASCHIKKHRMHVIPYTIYDTRTQSMGRMHDTSHSVQRRPTSTIHDAHSTQFRVQSAAQNKQRERTSKKQERENIPLQRESRRAQSNK